MRRTCKKPRGAEGSGGVKRPDGDYTYAFSINLGPVARTSFTNGG